MLWLWLGGLVFAFVALNLLITVRKARARRRDRENDRAQKQRGEADDLDDDEVVTDFDDVYRERLMRRAVRDEIDEAFDALDDAELDWD